MLLTEPNTKNNRAATTRTCYTYQNLVEVRMSLRIVESWTFPLHRNTLRMPSFKCLHRHNEIPTELWKCEIIVVEQHVSNKRESRTSYQGWPSTTLPKKTFVAIPLRKKTYRTRHVPCIRTLLEDVEALPPRIHTLLSPVNVFAYNFARNHNALVPANRLAPTHRTHWQTYERHISSILPCHQEAKMKLFVFPLLKVVIFVGCT